MTFDIFKTHLWFLVVLLLAAILGKFIGGGAGALLSRMNRQEAAIIGFSLNGRGAVELVVASIGLKLGIIDDAIFSVLVLVAFVTTMLPPLSLGFYLKRLKSELPSS